MITIRISDVNISVLFEYLGNLKELEWYETFSLSEDTVGFFELLIKQGMYVWLLHVLVHHDNSQNDCRILIRHAPKPYTLGYSRRPRKLRERIIRELRNLAQEHGWALRIEDETEAELHLSVRCPSCHAVYSYPEDRIDLDGNVKCQNCNNSFSVLKLYKPIAASKSGKNR